MHIPKEEPRYILVKKWCKNINFFIRNYPEIMNYCAEKFASGDICIFYKRIYMLEKNKICQYRILRRKKIKSSVNQQANYNAK